MFGGQRRYEQFLDRNGGEATIYVLNAAGKARNPRNGMKRELRGAAVGASLAVQDFASFLWPDRKTGPAPVRAFVKALGGAGSGMVPAHRVLTLALLNTRLSHTQPGSLDSLMENAAEIIEVGNASERWVVDFGPVPTTEPREGEQNRWAVFVFGTAQRMIEAAIGTEVERDQVASALATFVPFYELGVEYRENELVHNHYGNVVP